MGGAAKCEEASTAVGRAFPSEASAASIHDQQPIDAPPQSNSIHNLGNNISSIGAEKLASVGSLSGDGNIDGDSGRKRGLANILSWSGKANGDQEHQINNKHTIYVPEDIPTKPIKSWLSGRLGRRSRPSSADIIPAGVSLSDGPIVGDIPLIAGPPPEGAEDTGTPIDRTIPTEGNSPKETAASAPTSALTTPQLNALDIEINSAFGISQPTHRRNRSWFGTLGWNKPPRSKSLVTASSDDLDMARAIHGVANIPNVPSADGTSLIHGVADIDSLEIEQHPGLPPGTRGILNVGNSCYIAAAFQCLRFTPSLPLRLVPDLLDRAAAQPQTAQEIIPPPALLHQSGTSQGTVTTTVSANPKPTDAASISSLDAHMSSGAAPGPDQKEELLPVTEGTESPSTTNAGLEEASEAPDSSVSPAAPPPPRPVRGELSNAVSSLIADLYLNPIGGKSRSVDPSPLLQILRRIPAAEDYFDGRQHDCQEVLQMLIDLLHEDLNTASAARKQAAVPPEGEVNDGGEFSGKTRVLGQSTKIEKDGSSSAVTSESNSESAKADAAWAEWQHLNSSPISDLFMGQLQSCVVCSKCNGRFTMYEPFWELSLPLIPKSGSNTLTSWFGLKPGGPLSLQDCLQAFTSEERLEGEEAFDCEVCKEKTRATKRLRLHRLPDALVLHIKRFRHSGSQTDKLATNVTFPLRGLDLSPHGSPECYHSQEHCCYDLYAVSNHSGNVGAGHYTACCRPVGGVQYKGGGGTEGWWCFNDEVVTPVDTTSVVSQNAYILFYHRRKYKDSAAAAAVYSVRAQQGQQGHRRSRSVGSSGSGGGLFSGAFLRGGGGEAK